MDRVLKCPFLAQSIIHISHATDDGYSLKLPSLREGYHHFNFPIYYKPVHLFDVTISAASLQ